MSEADVRHLLVEERLLRHGEEAVRRKIRHLKSQGLKTEPAFATVFALTGDPYDTLLGLAELCEEELLSFIRQRPDASLQQRVYRAIPLWRG